MVHFTGFGSDEWWGIQRGVNRNRLKIYKLLGATCKVVLWRVLPLVRQMVPSVVRQMEFLVGSELLSLF